MVLLLKPARLNTDNPITIKGVSFLEFPFLADYPGGQLAGINPTSLNLRGVNLQESQLSAINFLGVNFPESGVSFRWNWGSASTGILKILKIIKNEITIPDSLRNRSGFLFIKYIINCNGEVVNLGIIKTADSDGKINRNDFELLSVQIFNILKKELKWNPARQGGRTVDFYQICSVTFNMGEISIRLTAT